MSGAEEPQLSGVEQPLLNGVVEERRFSAALHLKRTFGLQARCIVFGMLHRFLETHSRLGPRHSRLAKKESSEVM